VAVVSGARPEELGGESFQASVERLLEVPPTQDPRDLATVLDGLARFLAMRFPALSASDIAEIGSESVARLVAASREGRLDTSRSPAPYLTRTAHNLAVSALRGPRVVAGNLNEEASPLADDELAALLDARASSEILQAGLVQAVQVGDHVLVRVVRAWLELAECQGSPPASREVAKRLGLSHTTINDALQRLGKYLPK